MSDVREYLARGIPRPWPRQSQLPPPGAKHWLLRTILAQRPWSLLASLCMALGFVATGMIAVIVGHAIDAGVAAADSNALLRWLGWLVVDMVVLVCAHATARYFMFRSEQLIGHDMRMAFLSEVLSTDATKSSRLDGELLSIASTDIRRVSSAVSMTVFPVAEFAAISFVAIMMFRTQWWLGLVVLIAGPLMSVLAVTVARPLQRSTTKRQQSLGELAGLATDMVAGLRVLKGLGAVEEVQQRYRNSSARALTRTMHTHRADARLETVTFAAGLVFSVLITVLSGVAAIKGHITVGEVVTAIGLSQFIIKPMTMFGRNLASVWASASASGSRIQEVLLTEHQLHHQRQNLPAFLERLGPGVVCVPTLDVEAKQACLEALREYPFPESVVAPHNAMLFSDTVLANVELWEEPTLSAQAALDMACASDIPGGYERFIGEEGTLLSGGQRQRVGLARALACPAMLVVLDDPTTAVDSVTEQRIAEQISAAAGARTILVFSNSPAWKAVARRISTEELLSCMREGA